SCEFRFQCMRGRQRESVGTIWCNQCHACGHVVLSGAGGHMDAGVAQQGPESIEDWVAGHLQARRSSAGSAGRHNDVDVVELCLDGLARPHGERSCRSITFTTDLCAGSKKGFELRAEAVGWVQAFGCECRGSL